MYPNSNATLCIGEECGLFAMAKNPVKEPLFQKTLQSLLGMKPKTQSEMKIGKKKPTKKAAKKNEK